jgi:4-hydroxybenzoyl-CoA thioesterase
MAYTTIRPLRFGDCDPSGIAYFPSYLNILVGVVEEFFASIGTPWHELVAKQRIGTPTLKLDILFSHPGFHGDQLEFTLRVMALGRTSLELEHQIHSRGRLLWSARQKLVATSLDTHKSCPWPDDLRAALQAHLEN